jgi:hypothetical protein
MDCQHFGRYAFFVSTVTVGVPDLTMISRVDRHRLLRQLSSTVPSSDSPMRSTKLPHAGHSTRFFPFESAIKKAAGYSRGQFTPSGRSADLRLL